MKLLLPLQPKNYLLHKIKYLSAKDLMKFVQEQNGASSVFPDFSSGDTITVHYKIKEGNKERIQQYRGVVIQRKGGNSISATFTVRKMSGEIGVERIFPVTSPFIEKIEVNKHGKVRRAKIYYFRKLTGKKARIAEKRYSTVTT